MLVVAAGLLLTGWIIEWFAFEIPNPWIHVSPLMGSCRMVVHVMRTAPSKPPRRHGR
jgi:hypothetical protein